MNVIRVSHPTKKIKASVHLPGSKSESNRLLILKAISGREFNLTNPSNARDTQNLMQILSSSDEVVNVWDAGTNMRFLTAYYCAINHRKTINCSAEMKQRPIEPLVNSLSEMGFDVRYAERENFPPLEIFPVNMERVDNETFIEGNISSQFITALLLIAPFLPNGLRLNFITGLVSQPYVEMTIKILAHFGIQVIRENNFIEISKTELQAADYQIGGDWSAASYWYVMAFLADEAEIFLEGLKNDWVQGDQVIAEWMAYFGVTTEFKEGGAMLRKTSNGHPAMMKLNFKDNPDLAQSMAVMLAAKNIYATFSGIESLRIKETDRIAALQNELQKINVRFDYSDRYDFYQLKGDCFFTNPLFSTYKDHRMAMAFAPLALLGEIGIENPEVVEKSYPQFWSDLQKAGFVIS